MRGHKKLLSLIILVSSLLVACSPFATGEMAQQENPSDAESTTTQEAGESAEEPNNPAISPVEGGTIFMNGTVITMDETQPTAEAILIEGDRISAIGSSEDILAMAGEGTAIIDLEGTTLMPGFVDAHAHSFNNIWREDFEAGQQFLLSQGITSTAEMYVDEALIQDLQNFEASGQLRMRVSLYPMRVDNCGEDRGEWYWPDYPPSLDDGALLQVPGIKIFSDGGSCKRPARSFEYPDGSLGDLYHDTETLAGLIEEAQDHGYQVAIHGLGDRAINVNLDALEIALDGEANTFRHRLEHNTLLEGEMFDRFSEVDPVTLIFGAFPACFFVDESGQFKYMTTEENIQMEWAWRPLIDTNPDVHFAWHSDAPVFGEPLPMANIYGFLTRRQYRPDGTICEPAPWAADDLLTIDEVLPMMTIEAAYAIRRDQELGSLEQGKLADVIILPVNPLEADPETIRETQVLMTMVAGKVAWCAPGAEGFCPSQDDAGVSDETSAGSPPFGYIDFPSSDQTLSGVINIEGWALNEDGAIERVEIAIDGTHIGDAVYGSARPDVANDYPGRVGSPNFGFSFQLDTSSFGNGAYTLSVRAIGPAGDEGLLIPETLTFTIEN